MAFATQTTQYEGTGSGNANAPWVEHDYTYDDWDKSRGLNINGYHNLQQDVVTTFNGQQTTTQLTKLWKYSSNDSGFGGTGWIYYNVNKVSESETDDAAGHEWKCQTFAYDEGAPSGGPPAGTPGAGLLTTVNTYTNTNCHNGVPSNPLITTYNGYDNLGNLSATVDGVATANSGLYTGHGCTLNSTPLMSSAWTHSTYTSCITFDSSEAQPIQVANAFGQQKTISYDPAQDALPTSTTDLNNQNTTTAYSFDVNSSTNGKAITQVTLPNTNNSSPGNYSKQSYTNSSCPISAPNGVSNLTPCFETDGMTGLYFNAISQTFSDSQGRAVESITPVPPPNGAPSSNMYVSVVLTVYNDATHSVWTSVPFVVVAGSPSIGWIDPNGAVDYNGIAPSGTAIYYDALNRPIAMQDPRFNPNGGVPGISCPSFGHNATTCTIYGLATAQGDAATYESTTSLDANNHEAVSFSDALGRGVYTQEYSGVYGQSPSLIKQTSLQYNVLNEATQVAVTDESTSVTITTTAQYDDLGRMTQLADPDRGTHTFSYDNDGQLLTDVSGTRTLGYNDDLLGRIGCVQDAAPTVNWQGTCSAGHPLVQNTYDANPAGITWSNYPVGHLTQSVATTYYPDTSSATTTQNYQYDTRGNILTQQMQLGLPSSWNVSTALPTYQLALTYTDANQPFSATTSMINPSSSGATTSQLYDSSGQRQYGTGMLTGLSNGTTTLATLAMNTNTLIGLINYQSSTGSTIASEQFSYDGDLRLSEAKATWQSNGLTIFDQQRGYDSASNVTSLITTLAAVPGVPNSGGSETQNFCYNEQNQLTWASNTNNPPAPGSGTCGNLSQQSGLSGANYLNIFSYTHLGELAQGPLNGANSAQGPYQFLYCGSPASHQLTGVYPFATTCANKDTSGHTAQYTNTYDAWGNVTSRTYGGTTATLSYNGFDQMTQWWSTPGTNEQYVYDASGKRVLRRSSSGGVTGLTVYAFGLEEHLYTGSGSNQGNTYYYSLAGQLIGELIGSPQTTNFLLTDGLGSVLATFSNTQGSAAVLGNQVYSPYGPQRYQKGQMGTNKGFTGQYNDSVSGLDYYNARYYDPAVGLFLSADHVQGNLQAMNPYAYVAGNPETKNDPTGQHVECGDTCGSHGGNSNNNGGPPSQGHSWQRLCIENGGCGQTRDHWDRTNVQTLCRLDPVCHRSVSQQSFNTFVNFFMSLVAIGTGAYEFYLLTHPEIDQAILDNVEGATSSAELTAMAEEENLALSEQLAADGICSFLASTLVTTQQGKQAIGTLHVGQKVLAYNPTTQKMELQPILHVWIHSDHDLVDLTLTLSKQAQHGKATGTTREVIHTTQKHPFLTVEQGFLPVGQLTLGMHVIRADGHLGIITGWKLVPGARTMYNLEVAHDHTFTVGDGQWIVHNACGGEYAGSYNSNFPGANRDYLGSAGGFSNDDELLTHFDDHGKAMGYKNPTAYENSAIRFMSDVPNKDILQLTAENGDTVRWNTKTGEFGISNDIGNVITYYDISNKDDPYQYFTDQYGR